MFVTETALILVERPFVVKHDHPGPGDWTMTVLVPAPCWAVVLWLLHGSLAWTGAATIVATGIYALLTVLLVKLWKEDNDREEVRRKIRETSGMARRRRRRASELDRSSRSTTVLDMSSSVRCGAVRPHNQTHASLRPPRHCDSVSTDQLAGSGQAITALSSTANPGSPLCTTARAG